MPTRRCRARAAPDAATTSRMQAPPRPTRRTPDTTWPRARTSPAARSWRFELRGQPAARALAFEHARQLQRRLALRLIAQHALQVHAGGVQLMRAQQLGTPAQVVLRAHRLDHARLHALRDARR